MAPSLPVPAERSLREVAERAGLSQAGVLHHFGSKTELLTAVLTRRDELTAADPDVRGLAARGLGSLTDGLQVYWLYHRDHDMAADIRAYMQALLTVPL